MIETFIRGMARMRWMVVLLWVAVVAGSVVVMPDLGQIVKQTETKFVPDNADSMRARQLIERIQPDDKARSNAVIVLHRDGGLTADDRTWLDGKVQEFKRNTEALGLQAVHSAFDDPQVAAKFRSKDKTTELVVVDLPHADAVGATQHSVELLRQQVTDVPSGAEAYLTGSAPINKDYVQTSQDGLKKTEVLTVVLVLGILLAVFRSPLAPLIPLLTIALSFMLSRGFIALATRWGLPVSPFTETFLVAVLFGAGTDYCILLIHRFREELSHGLNRVDAMVRTMQTVGKTVLYSGSTVLIAFFLIGFAKFGLYQSAVGVSIGMLATLIAGVTLTPALMLLFGPKLFWPFKIKPGQGHGESKVWGAMGRLVARKPLAVLLITVLVLAPFTLLFHNTRSFDDVAEIDPNIGSVKGFRVVEKAFSSGEVLPVTVTLTSSTSMRTAEGLAALEKASTAAAQVAHVSEVRSAARPLGEQIKELAVPYQLNEANKVLGEIKSGVGQVGDGLKNAKSQLGQGTSSIDQLTNGLNQITDNQKKIAQGTSQLADGTGQIAAKFDQGASDLQGGLPKLSQMQQGLQQVTDGIHSAQGGLQSQIQPGLQQSRQGLAQVSGGVTQLQGVASSMGDDLNELLKAHPELAQDASFQTALGKQQALAKGLTNTANGLQPLNGGLAQLQGGVGKVADGLGTLADGSSQLAGGVVQLHGQMKELTQGMRTSSQYLHQMSEGAGQATQGLYQLADGTGKVTSGVGQMKSQLGQLTDGLGQGADGLQKVTDGLAQVRDAQQGIVDNGPKQIAGWYLPPDQLTNSKDLKTALDTYISPDGKTTRLDVVLSINPYSPEARATIDTLRDAVQQSLKGTAIDNPEVLLAGTTAQYHELDSISKQDFLRTGALILVGIYVVLALLLRSAIAPLYILLSLGFSYLVTMGIVEFVFVKWFGAPCLSWTVSFFGFLLLVALGVDYSIFLMARFREEYVRGGVVAAMQKAMSSTGGVIISAALIMGGTFAALMFSGVTSLVQIGATVLIGLTIYTTVVMGLIVPALAMLFGEANWWPLNRNRDRVQKQELTSSL